MLHEEITLTERKLGSQSVIWVPWSLFRESSAIVHDQRDNNRISKRKVVASKYPGD
jgi:hypothetical protein